MLCVGSAHSQVRCSGHLQAGILSAQPPPVQRPLFLPLLATVSALILIDSCGGGPHPSSDNRCVQMSAMLAGHVPPAKQQFHGRRVFPQRQMRMRMLLPAELAWVSDWPKQPTSTEAFRPPAAWLGLGASLLIFMRLCSKVSHLQHH